MKKIGIIGGVGPSSTIEYYQQIIKGFQERMETRDYPELIISSVNMTEMLNYVFNNRYDELIDFLIARIKPLEAAGVDYIAIASNTPHIVFDTLASQINTPLISIVEETCKVLHNNNIKRAGLLGTRSTMTKGFYNKIAAKYNIEMLIPAIEQQNYVHEKYMSELVYNRILPETKKELIKIIYELKTIESIEAIVLGGTELPLILSQADFRDLKIFDTTMIHVESIVSKIIEN